MAGRRSEFEFEHYGISSSDRVIPSDINVRKIPRATRKRVADLARTRKWGPEEIFDQMRSEGIKVSLDEIYALTRN